jgi:hypothetical protein
MARIKAANGGFELSIRNEHGAWIGIKKNGGLWPNVGEAKSRIDVMFKAGEING